MDQSKDLMVILLHAYLGLGLQFNAQGNDLAHHTKPVADKYTFKAVFLKHIVYQMHIKIQNV